MTKNDLINCFYNSSPTAAQKHKMLAKIQDSGTGKLVVKRSGKRLYLTAALITTVILTMTTVLAIGFRWDEKLIEYLNPSEEQMAALDSAADTPEATISKNGVTITVKQTLADSFGIYVLYEMTVPSNIELNDNVEWMFSQLDVPTVTMEEHVSIGTISSEILDQDDNKRTVLVHLQETTMFESGILALHFQNLGYYNFTQEDTAPEFIPLVEGEWHIEWEFNCVDISNTVEVNTPLSINGSENTITRVVISPLSVCVFVEGDDILMSGIRPAVNFNDGSQIAYDVYSDGKSFGYFLVDEAALTYANQLYYRFDRIIDLEDVVSITVGDVTIPIR